MSRYQELISTGIVLTIVTGGIAGAVTGFALNEIAANRAVFGGRSSACSSARSESHPPTSPFSRLSAVRVQAPAQVSFPAWCCATRWSLQFWGAWVPTASASASSVRRPQR